MVLTYLFAGKEWRLRCREWTCGPSGGRRGWDGERGGRGVQEGRNIHVPMADSC